MSNIPNEDVRRRDALAAAQTGSTPPMPTGPARVSPAPLGGTAAPMGSGQAQQKQRSEQEAEAVKRQASEAAGSLKAQASEAAEAVSQEACHVAEDARRSAVEAGQRLRSEGAAMISRQKNAAAEELTHLRDALNAASSKLEEEDDRRLADLTHIVADRLDAAAGYLRHQDLNHLAADLAQTARRRPTMFYGGLFMVGLAASRFLKASSPRSDSSRAQLNL